jgi:DNA-binding transcriptional ArsR family regulator
LASKEKKGTAKEAGELAGRPRNFIDPRLVKAMGHPVRNDALSILNERVASPNEIAKELGESVGHVSYHVKVLKECDCIELVDTAPRRGAMEHYYRATARAFLDDDEWARLPDSIRPGMSASLLRTITNDAGESLKSGKFEGRKDRHMSWTPMLVDEAGWSELTKGFESLLDLVLEVQRTSAERLAEADAEGIPISAALLAYEAAGPERKRIIPKKD